MKRPLLILAICLLYLGISSCKRENNLKIERAFYYWKNENIDDALMKNVQSINVKKIYFKIFEVDYSETRGNFPYNKNNYINYNYREKDSISIVPTIFIRNEIFKFNNNESLDLLADNIVFLVNKYCNDNFYNREKINFDEIQIDCDWTKSTKEKYFYLLKKIKTISGKKLSCTLRLYPYAYSDIMGVPPVDKVSLMCYNLISPLSEKAKNSILDISELKKYLTKKVKYPVHIDLALPLFYWTQLYQNNQFSGLMDLDAKQIKSFTKPAEQFWYDVIKDTAIGYRYFLREGDKIKCEEVSLQTLKAALNVIEKNVALNNNVTISFFDLDKSIFNKYSNEEINAIYNRLAQ